MGDVARQNHADRVEKKITAVFKRELDDADIVVSILGGMPEITKKNKKLKVVVIDYDNADEVEDTKRIQPKNEYSRDYFTNLGIVSLQ